VATTSFLLSALAAELAARFLFRTAYPYSVWPPNVYRVFRPDPGILPGIEGESRFWTSSAGLRADEFSPDQRYRILALGGSTTECLYLDQEEAWPNLLQRRLAEALGTSVWVGNAGISGRSSHHHALQAEYLLPQYPRIDAVLVLAGANDLLKRLGSDRDWTPDPPREDLLLWAFYQRPYGTSLSASALVRLYSRYRALQRFRQEPLYQDAEGRIYERWRRQRKRALAIVRDLPDLRGALDIYGRNLERIAEVAAAHGASAVFVTQPALWREGLSPEELDLLWMGGLGRRGKGKRRYYAPEALAEGLRLFNERTLEVCRARRLLCVDLARWVPRDLSAFYDDLHFNEGGARTVARALAEALAASDGWRSPRGRPEAAQGR
jgi:lysophospholipase L1-like esterase